MKLPFNFSNFTQFILFLAFSSFVRCLDLANRVVGAVNCGGRAVTGAHNIRYSDDNVKVGIASEVGMKYAFNNAYPLDVPIYQTERWHSDDFRYSFPVKQDGEYVIMLKFSEVYFQRKREKIFDVSVNGVKVLQDFDIFSLTKGRGYALDHYVPISIKGKKITVLDEVRSYNGEVVVDFEKGLADNPKVNGIAIIRGDLSEMPKLPEMVTEEDENEDEDEIEEIEKYSSMRNTPDDDEEFEAAAPVQNKEFNPLERESDFRLTTIIVTIVILIPVMYFLQKKT